MPYFIQLSHSSFWHSHYLLSSIDSKKVSIFGFSFFEEGWKEQHYFESITPYARGHNPQLEKEYVNFLKEQNYIRIY